jgi:lysyl-tRNA synthetase class 2
LSEENQPIEQNENHVILERREKLKKIREAGVAFPNDFKPQHFAKTIHE